MKRKYKWLIGCLVFIAILLLSAGMYFFHVAEVRDVAADKPDKLRAKTNSLYHYEHDFCLVKSKHGHKKHLII